MCESLPLNCRLFTTSAPGSCFGSCEPLTQLPFAMVCAADASSTSVRLCPLLIVMLDCTKLFPHICTVGILPLLLPPLLLPQLPEPPQAARRAATRLSITNDKANFFMVSIVLLHALIIPMWSIHLWQ